MPGLSATTSVAIIGAGTMGAGIAQVAAAAGHPVLLFDARANAPAHAITQIKGGLARLIERKRMSEADAAALTARIQPCVSLAELKDAGLVIEAIVEDMAVKKTLFAELEGLLKPDAILINTCRGPVVDEAALIDALQNKRILAAGLDVTEVEPIASDSPLLQMDNVVISPHMASISEWANGERRRRPAQEIAAVLTGHLPRAVWNKEVLEHLNLK